MRTSAPTILAVALLTTACGAIIGLEDVPPPVVSADTTAAIAAFAQAYCARFAICQPGNFAYNFDNSDECLSTITAGQTYLASLPGTGSNAAAFQLCSTTTANLSCQQFATTDIALVCLPGGQLGAGQTCAEDVQCASDFCGLVDNTGCRACVAAQPSEGAACGLGNDCGPSLVCSSKGTCVRPQPDVGDGCAATAPCARGLACTSAGTCATLPSGNNADCDVNVGCDTAHNFVCVGGKCATFSVSPAGQPCGFDGSTYQICRRNAACIKGSNVCAAPPGEGDACTTDGTGPTCLYPLQCVGGVCTPLTPAVCK